MAKILVVEDDRLIAEGIVDLLVSNNHVVDNVEDGKEALDRLKFYYYDLIVLDWELPSTSGIDILKQLRASGCSSPVLMLTGRVSESDLVTGLDAGAADYLKKPFQMRELQARVKALLRRPSDTNALHLSIRGFRLDAASYSLGLGDKQTSLLPKEFAVFQLLLRSNASDYVNLETIADYVWSADSAEVGDAIRTCIRRLRAKMETDLDAHGSIESKRGLGYRISPSLHPE
ncbi:MAG: response regulator transcription factor [Candidatus Obscuribacterales bacterium]|nr:response regulator transcription factor [Candidatus Obscuribacterales bacterium]